VRKVVYVPPDEALKEFEKSLGPYGDIASDLPYNPIPPSFEVYVKSPAYLPQVGRALKDMGVFDDVLVPSEFALKLSTLMDSARKFIYSVMLLFVFMSFVMIFLTISASVTSHRDEIEVYRYMGASMSYIYAPFVMLGFLYGFVGSAVGIAFAIFAASVLKPHIESLSEVILGVIVKPSSGVWVASSVALLIGLGVALAATALSVRRFTAELEVGTL
jgi:cell division transport system permease protein